jgi:hypothetical protein
VLGIQWARWIEYRIDKLKVRTALSERSERKWIRAYLRARLKTIGWRYFDEKGRAMGPKLDDCDRSINAVHALGLAYSATFLVAKWDFDAGLDVSLMLCSRGAQ